jgi:hypothetical protein
VLLLQFTENENSRTYMDFDTINEALDGMVQIFEQKLRVANSDAPQIVYSLSDLIIYMEKLHDLSCLTYND